MVAYGVLELKPKETPLRALFLDADADELDRERAENFERDQIRKLVADELRRYGLLIARQIVPKGAGWRTKQFKHVLYGQLEKNGFGTRAELHVGSFKECCEVAAKILDELDRAQEQGT